MKWFSEKSNAEKAEILSTKQLRQCSTVHECCICFGDITSGMSYFDGGYGKRAHEQCVNLYRGRS